MRYLVLIKDPYLAQPLQDSLPEGHIVLVSDQIKSAVESFEIKDGDSLFYSTDRPLRILDLDEPGDMQVTRMGAAPRVERSTKSYDRNTLIRELQENRGAKGKGRGSSYWDSVADIVEQYIPK